MPTTVIKLLQQARRDGFAIAALNAVNLETAEAIVMGAELECAPVILQISENAARYSSLTRLAAIGRTLRDEASVPVALHYDHAESVASAQRAIESGFDSVMLEARAANGGKYEEALRTLVRAAHSQGVAVEAEVEAVQKGERESGVHLDPERVRALAEDSGCDWVAINIGTEHKQTQKTANLDLHRLASIARVVPQPLVLHGSSGVPDDMLRESVRLGITKVNVSTALSVAFTRGVCASLRGKNNHEPREYLGAGRSEMVEEVRAYIRRLGSSGRADELA